MGKLINISNCPKEQYIDIYEPDGTLIAHTNDTLEIDWIRVQIKNMSIKGCYAIFDGERIEINERGIFMVKEYPKNFPGNVHMDVMIELL